MTNDDDLNDATPSLLLVDDDDVFCHVMAGALRKRGYRVNVAHNAVEGIHMANACHPEYAVVDLKMPGDSGLVLVQQLVALDPELRIVVLTGYGSIATAVEAIKLGATHYLAKPADADQVLHALHRGEGNPNLDISASALSVGRVEWEYIQKALADHDGNISATARALKMHRRTLQRKLAKRPVRD